MPFYDAKLSNLTWLRDTANGKSLSCALNVSGDSRCCLKRRIIFFGMYIPHKIIHEVRDDGQLAYLPGIDVLFEEDDLLLAEGLSSAGVSSLVETVGVASCVKIPVWS